MKNFFREKHFSVLWKTKNFFRFSFFSNFVFRFFSILRFSKISFFNFFQFYVFLNFCFSIFFNFVKFYEMKNFFLKKSFSCDLCSTQRYKKCYKPLWTFFGLFSKLTISSFPYNHSFLKRVGCFFIVQWWLQIRELQIRELSLIWPEITKMANKGILKIPLFDIKINQIWLDFVFISASLEF